MENSIRISEFFANSPKTSDIKVEISRSQDQFQYFDSKTLKAETFIFMSEIFASQAIRQISRIFIEFNFANHEDLFILRELIFAKLDFPPTKILLELAKKAFFMS